MSQYIACELADVCKIRYGKDHKRLDSGNIPIYGSGGIMRYGNQAISNKPSVLIPRKGTLSNLYYVDQPFWTVDTLFWTDIDSSKILPPFLYYSLRTKNLASLNVGTAVPSLTAELLSTVTIQVPPIEIQNKICEVLRPFDLAAKQKNYINDYLAA